MLGIAAKIYEELRTAGQGAFHAIVNAGAPQFAVSGLQVPGSVAVELTPYVGERIYHKRLYVLDTGHPISADGTAYKKGFWSNNAKPVVINGRSLLSNVRYSEVQVQRVEPSFKLVAYLPSNAEGAGQDFIATYHLSTQLTKVWYGERQYTERSATDFIAMRTAERLTELKHR